MKRLPSGGQWLFLLLLALGGVASLPAQNSAQLRTTRFSFRRWANCGKRPTPIKRLLSNGSARAGIPASAPCSRRSWKTACISAIAIRKSSSSKRPMRILSTLIDPISLKDAGTASADCFTKIGTNNSLRSTLRTTVAHFALSSPDAAVRLDAVQEMAKSLDEADRSAAARAHGRRKQIPALRKRSPPAWRSPRSMAPIATRGCRRSPRLRRASARMCATAWRTCLRKIPTAASPKATKASGRPLLRRWEPSTVGATSIPASRLYFSV